MVSLFYQIRNFFKVVFTLFQNITFAANQFARFPLYSFSIVAKPGIARAFCSFIAASGALLALLALCIAQQRNGDRRLNGVRG